MKSSISGSSICSINNDFFPQVSDLERVALIAIYNLTNGDNWHYGHSSIAYGTEWLGIKGTECNWYGINCASDSVTSLSLNALELKNVDVTLNDDADR